MEKSEVEVVGKREGEVEEKVAWEVEGKGEGEEEGNGEVEGKGEGKDAGNEEGKGSCCFFCSMMTAGGTLKERMSVHYNGLGTTLFWSS